MWNPNEWQHGGSWPFTRKSSESSNFFGIASLKCQSLWSGFTYQKPIAPVSLPGPSFQISDQTYGDELWRPYKQPGDNDISQHPSYSVLVAAEQAKMLRIVHETISVYCGSRGKVTAHHLINLYETFLIWKDDLPNQIRDVDAQALPHVIFLQ